MAIKKTDIQSLNFLALKAITEMKKSTEYKEKYEEWKKKKGTSNHRESAK